MCSKESNRGGKTASIVWALLVLLGSIAEARTGPCLQVDSKPSGVKVTMKGSIVVAGRTPARFCFLEAGQSYEVAVTDKGYEERWAKLSFDMRGEAHLTRSYGFVKSLLVPGWGQAARGERLRALQAFADCAVAAVGLLLAVDRYRESKDDWRDLEGQVASAGSAQELRVLERSSFRQGKLTNTERNYLLAMTALAGWSYCASAVEAFLFHLPPRVVKKEPGKLVVSIPRRTRLRAVARSVFFPGMGQAYLGQRGKAILMQGLFLGAAFNAAYAKRRYDRARVDYEMELFDLERAGSVAELAKEREQASSQWERLRREERRRNASYALLGSVWVVSVVDALFSASPAETARFSLGSVAGKSGMISYLTVRF